MDALTFISEIVKAAAWPIAATVIALLFRTELRGLLGRIKKGKVGPAEFEFEQEVAELKEEATALKPSPAQIEVSPQLVSQALSDQRGAIVSAWLQVEESARRVVRSKELIPERMIKNPVSLIRAISGAKLLDARHVALLDSLRDLRNRAAHDSEFSTTPDSVLTYLRVAAEVKGSLDEILKRA